MLAVHSLFRSVRPTRPRLRIYSPEALRGSAANFPSQPGPRSCELQPIGKLMPQVLARYLPAGGAEDEDSLPLGNR